MDRKIILFELNEVPLRVFDYFVKAAPDSALARIMPRSKQIETYTEDKGHLSPWITWPTLHRGVTNEKHYISDFGQDLKERNEEFPSVWEILAKNGVKTGVFGSFHSYPLPKERDGYAFYVPDVFAASSECLPVKAESFQDFNLKMSRESGRNVAAGIPWGAAFKFLKDSPALGIKASTAMGTMGQLVSERSARWKVVRRRTYQTILSFDVFEKQLRSTRPDFSTFFTNHVASSMHRYWAASFPEDYDELQLTEEWLSQFSQEIFWTMSKADKMIARLQRFVHENPEYQLWIVSSMGQEATVANSIETQLYITDDSKFLESLGVPKAHTAFRPSMLPQFNIQVDEEYCSTMEESLQSFRINGNPVKFRRDNQFFSIDLGHSNLKETIVELNGQQVSMEQMGLENVEIQDKSGTTAYHIPQGSMFIYDPKHVYRTEQRTSISTLEVAPSILKNFSVKAPSYMAKPSMAELELS